MSVRNFDVWMAFYKKLEAYASDNNIKLVRDGDETPTNVRYIEEHFLPAEVEFPTKTKTGYNTATGIYQINVYANRGSARYVLMQLADDIVEEMSSDVSLICNSGRITINNVYASDIMADEAKMMIAITVNYLLAG